MARAKSNLQTATTPPSEPIGSISPPKEAIAADLTPQGQPKLKVKRLHPDALVPVYATAGAACFDIHALFEEFDPEYRSVVTNRPKEFRTGLAFEVPAGFVMLIFSRSGHGFRSDVRLSNCVGVIDSDYRGEVKVKLAADGVHGSLQVKPGDRIAQGMLVRVDQVAFEAVDELATTERGEGGFGSTGK